MILSYTYRAGDEKLKRSGPGVQAPVEENRAISEGRVE